MIDVNSKVVVDASLAIGERTETVTVSESAAHVETADTQMGEVITGKQMTAVPLNGRSYTDLLALQSGVVPVTSLTSDTTQDVGVSAFSPSGDLNPGTISINGQREFANSFVLNGSDVEEDVNMGAAIIPNLDSIAEFRILTSNFDAEHGEFSGGQISVVTKSGTNAFHGDVFEFLRNTDLDARNYLFAHARGVRPKPVRRNHWAARSGRTRFFSSPIIKERDRPKESIRAKSRFRPSQDRTGNLSDVASSLTGTVSGPYCRTASLAEARLWRDCRRGLLFPWMHQLRAVRSSQRRNTSKRVVGSGGQSLEIHSSSQQSKWHFFDLGL